MRYYNSTNVFLYNSSLIYASERYVLRLESRRKASNSCCGLKGRVFGDFAAVLRPPARPDTNSTYECPEILENLHIRNKPISYRENTSSDSSKPKLQSATAPSCLLGRKERTLAYTTIALPKRSPI